MFYLSIVISIGVFLGSAYLFMHSLKQNRKQKEIFYSELLPFIRHADLREEAGLFPSMGGIYEGYKIKVVPIIDNLCYRGLPRLYIRIYISIKNNEEFRVVRLDERKHLFPEAGFEKESILIGANKPEFEMFLTKGQNYVEPEGIWKVLTQIDGCSEVLLKKNFVRVTLLLARGQKSHYAVLRSVKFPLIMLKYEKFKNYFDLVFKLRRGVTRIELAD